MADCEKFRMPFGKYKDQSLLEISESDEGLKYLDWMLAEMKLQPATKDAVEEFVALPHIEREIERVVG